MVIELIQGQFNTQETLELITQMIHVKIKYHEDKILVESTEEDIKNRESKIKQLQEKLYQARKGILKQGKFLKIEANINIE